MMEDMIAIINIEHINFIFFIWMSSDSIINISKTIMFYLDLKVGSPLLVYNEDDPVITASKTIFVKKRWCFSDGVELYIVYVFMCL